MTTARAFTCAIVFALGLLAPSLAWAFNVPAIHGHVNDLTGTLDDGQKATLNRQMEGVNQGSTVEIGVLVLPTLGGETIEDVAFKTFNTWKLGKAKKDNGALLVISTGDRRTRIEVGKGIEGSLTDLQTNDILHQRVGPLLKQGVLFLDILVCVTTIASAAAGQYTVSAPSTSASNGPLKLSPGVAILLYGVAFAFVGGIIIYLQRAMTSGMRGRPGRDTWGGGGGGNWGGGGSSGGSDFGGGGGGGGGGDFSGGGG